MAAQKTKYQGVISRESKTRKHKGKPDRCFYIRYYVGSVQQEEKVGWISEGYSAEAAQAVRNKRLHLRRNHNVSKKSIMFKDAAEQYFEWAKITKKSWMEDKYKYDMHVASAFDSYPLDTIRPADIISFVQKLKSIKNKRGDDYKPQTILHYVKIIRQIYSWAQDTELYDGQNPAIQKKVKLAKFDNSREMYLYDEEIRNLFKACDDKAERDNFASMVR